VSRIRVPAGIFIPSLAAGAAFGRISGLFLNYISISFPSNGLLPHGKEIVPGVYALIGAAATLAGVTRTTVSLVVIVVELTATLDYVVPVALTVLVAKTVADALEHDGIYDLVIRYVWQYAEISDPISPFTLA
jgi:chloride channel 3/4/5